MINGSRIAFMGYRSQVAKVALAHGASIAIWNPDPLSPKVRKRVLVIHRPFPESAEELDAEVLDPVRAFQPHAVIAVTEASVLAAALLRRALALPGLAPEVAADCRDKYLMKKRARAAGIPVTKFRLIRDSTSTYSLVQRLGFPMIMKQRSSSGSRGLRIFLNFSEVDLHRKRNYLAESFVNGREISTEFFVHRGRIVFQNITEYYQPLAINIVPGRTTPTELEQVRTLAQKVVAAFEFERGLFHLELFLTADGPLFGELAARPPGGYIMDLLQMSYGFDPWLALIASELGLEFDFPKRAQSVSAVHVLHPGQGRIRSIAGLEDLQRLAAVKDVKLKRDVGDRIEPRVGSGNDIGRILFAGDTHADVIDALEQSRSRLKIRVLP